MRTSAHAGVAIPRYFRELMAERKGSSCWPRGAAPVRTLGLRGSELAHSDNPSVMALRKTAMTAPFTQGSRGCSRTSAFIDSSRSVLGDCHTSDIGHWFAMTYFYHSAQKHYWRPHPSRACGGRASHLPRGGRLWGRRNPRQRVLPGIGFRCAFVQNRPNYLIPRFFLVR